MGEIETQKENGGGGHEKRFFKLKAAKTGHLCLKRPTEVFTQGRGHLTISQFAQTSEETFHQYLP